MSSVKTTINIVVVAAICLSLANNATAQESPKRFEIKLNQDNIGTLKAIGSLKAPVKEADRGKLNSVVIGVESNIKAIPMDVEGISFVGDAAVIAIDDQMIEQLDNEAIRFVSEGESFAKVYLKYVYSAPATEAVSDVVQQEETAPKDEAPSKTAPISEAPSTEPPASNQNSQTPVPDDDVATAKRVTDISYINLNNGKTIVGEIDGLNEFKMDCKFGEVTIPMEHVAGIRFHVDGDDNAVVVLDNGDTISGKPTVPAMSAETDWGIADVEPQFIDSITKAQNAKFSQEATDFGSRWVLKLIPYAPNNFPGNNSGGTPGFGPPQVIGK